MKTQIVIGGVREILEKKKPKLLELPIDFKMLDIKCPKKDCASHVFCISAISEDSHFFGHFCSNLDCDLDVFRKEQKRGRRQCVFCGRGLGEFKNA